MEPTPEPVSRVEEIRTLKMRIIGYETTIVALHKRITDAMAILHGDPEGDAENRARLQRGRERASAQRQSRESDATIHEWDGKEERRVGVERRMAASSSGPS